MAIPKENEWIIESIRKTIISNEEIVKDYKLIGIFGSILQTTDFNDVDLITIGNSKNHGNFIKRLQTAFEKKGFSVTVTTRSIKSPTKKHSKHIIINDFHKHTVNDLHYAIYDFHEEDLFNDIKENSLVLYGSSNIIPYVKPDPKSFYKRWANVLRGNYINSKSDIKKYKYNLMKIIPKMAKRNPENDLNPNFKKILTILNKKQDWRKTKKETKEFLEELSKTKILCIGCFHGKFPKGLNKNYIRRNNIDFVFALGDYPGRNLIVEFFKHSELAGRDPYGFFDWEPVKRFLGKRKCDAMEKHDRKEMNYVLKKLDSLGVPVYTVHGNHDETKNDPWYGSAVSKPTAKKLYFDSSIKKAKNIEYLDYKGLERGGFRFLFYGAKYPNVREVNKRRHEKMMKIRRDIRSFLMKNIRDASKTVIVTHQPPYNTKLDKVRDKNNPSYGKHFGDDVLRKVIERRQPLMCIAAHFHENQGFDRIGKTKLACTGYGKKGQAAILELKEGKEPKVRLVRIR